MAIKRYALLAVLFVCTACAGTTRTTPTTSPTTSLPPADTVATSDPGMIPVGQELDVRLQDRLSSETATVEQRFEATTVAPLMQHGDVLVPAGSLVRGVVTGVDEAGRLDRSGRLTLAFDRLVIDGESHPIRAQATQVFESEGLLDEGEKAAAGAGVGGIVGGILGGLKGALLGAVIGAGGVIAATEGEDVTLPAGTIVRIRMDSPVDVR